MNIFGVHLDTRSTLPKVQQIVNKIETGGQMAVFGRLGSRPFNRAEMEKLFLTRAGVPWKVSDIPDMTAWVGGRGPWLDREAGALGE